MNENVEELDRPIEPDTTELDTMWDAEDTYSEVDTPLPVAEETAPITDEVDTVVEPEEKETDYSPLLESISKEIKFMDEEVKFEDVEQLKTILQKGLNHDRIKGKLDEVENSEELTWVKQQAKEQGMTPKEYIKAVEEAKQLQERQQEEIELNDMLDNGIPEDIATKVIETNRVAKELAIEKARLKEQEAKQLKSKAEEQENEKFLIAFPDVDIKTIPKEVFKEAEEIGLIASYTKHQNKELQEKLKVMEQNLKNKETSPVTSTTKQGLTEKVNASDAFWQED